MRGRIRSIKPEVGCDEELWDLEQESGLPLYRAYTMLWCYADREGRFEWRPRALKVKVLPYFEGDFERVLEALERSRFIVRYEVDGKSYGWVRTFAKHQAINGKEPPSVLPAPSAQCPRPVESTSIAEAPPRVDDACPTRPGNSRGERNGTERNGNGKGAGTDARGGPPSNDVAPPVTELRAHRASKRALRSNDPAEPVSADHLHFPEGWRWSSETESAAAMAGVTTADLAEHVTWWTPRRWSVPVHDLDGALRAALPSIRKRAETQRAKALGPPHGAPHGGQRSRNSDALDYAFALATAEGAS